MLISNKKSSLWLLLVFILTLINMAMGSTNKSLSSLLLPEKRCYGTTTTTSGIATSNTIDCATAIPTPVITDHHTTLGGQQTTTVCSKCIQTPPLFDPPIIAAAVLLMLSGLYLMGGGFAFFRVTMAFIGLILGAAMTWISLHAAEPQVGYPSPAIFYLGCSIAGGLFIAVFSVFCWKVTIYFLCGMAGYLLSLFIWSWKEDFLLQNILARQIIGLGLGFLFILGFVLIEFATIVLSLSFIGAYLFVLGLDLFMKTGFVIGFRNVLYFDKHQYEPGAYVDAPQTPPINWTDATYKLDTKVYGMLCGVFGLWIIATAWQRWFNRGTRFGLRIVENTNNTLVVDKFKDLEDNK